MFKPPSLWYFVTAAKLRQEDSSIEKWVQMAPKVMQMSIAQLLVKLREATTSMDQ